MCEKKPEGVRFFKIRFASVAALICCLALLLAGCGKAHDTFYGKWGYIHDPATTIIRFKDGGKVEYKDAEYTYESDDSVLYLKDKSGTVTPMRYVMSGDYLYIYETTVYTLEENAISSEGVSDTDPAKSLIGRWVNAQNKWSFEFTPEGTFQEDGYFPGYYTVNAENSSIQLVYNDQFEDTVCYYTIQGNQLTIEYPWCMAKP